MADRLKQASRWLLAFPFIGIGWLVGFLVKCFRLMAALIIEGYQRGSKIV